MSQCFICGSKGLLLKVVECRRCRKNVCMNCAYVLPSIWSKYYKDVRNEKFISLTLNTQKENLQDWIESPYQSYLNVPIGFCSFECMKTFLFNRKVKNLEFIRNQKETVITFLHNHQRVFVIRDSLHPKLRKVFDYAIDKPRLDKLNMAENFETSHRFEDAAQIYESLEMWEEAGRMRRKEKQTTQMTVNVNQLIEQLRRGGITTTYKCTNCSGNISIDGETNVNGLKYCSYCGSAIKTHDLVDVIRRVL